MSVTVLTLKTHKPFLVKAFFFYILLFSFGVSVLITRIMNSPSLEPITLLDDSLTSGGATAKVSVASR